jgi:hypothetical protein
MRQPETVFIHCKISQGGFSGERITRFQQSDGSPYETVVATPYCRTPEGERLDLDVPPFNEEMDGRVEAILISNGGDTAKVELPDGSVVIVPAHQVLRREIKQEEYVPLGS